MKFKLTLLLLCSLTLLLLSCAGPEPVPVPTESGTPVIPEAPAETPTPLPRAAEVLPEPEPSAPPVVEEPELPDGDTISPGEETTFALEASAADGDTLSFWATNLPPGATFNNETQTFSWTPDYGQAGVYKNICFYVANEYGEDSECITIYVLSSNNAPTINPVPLRVAEVGAAMNITLQASDPDDDELEFSARNLPPGAQFSPPSFTWVPTEPGIWPAIYFSVSDGELTDTIRVVIVVKAES